MRWWKRPPRTAASWCRASACCRPPAACAARLAGGKLTLTDGPFTEAKEVVGGYAIFECASKAQMRKWTERFMELHRIHMPGWEGECEVRQIPDPGQEVCGQARGDAGRRRVTRLAAAIEVALVGSRDGYRHTPRHRGGLQDRAGEAHRRPDADGARYRHRRGACPGRTRRRAGAVAELRHPGQSRRLAHGRRQAPGDRSLPPQQAARTQA